MSIKKKLAAGVLLGGLMLSASMSIGAANPPAGSTTWSGDVGYGDVQVDSRIKTNPDAVTYLYYDGAPENVKVWLTTRKTTGTVASVKNILTLGEERYVSTGAAYGERVNIFASREHLGDQTFAMRGKWKP